MTFDQTSGLLETKVIFVYTYAWRPVWIVKHDFISYNSSISNIAKYTHYEIEATLISNIFETGQNFRKIKQSTGVFFKKIEKISNNSNTSKQQWKALSNNDQ